MATATIKAEFNIGELIEDAFCEATRLSKQLNCIIEFNFNGVRCFARPDGSADVGVKSYHNELEKPSFNMAFN